jgi:hypothetical protein
MYSRWQIGVCLGKVLHFHIALYACRLNASSSSIMNVGENPPIFSPLSQVWICEVCQWQPEGSCLSGLSGNPIRVLSHWWTFRHFGQRSRHDSLTWEDTKKKQILASVWRILCCLLVGEEKERIHTLEWRKDVVCREILKARLGVMKRFQNCLTVESRFRQKKSGTSPRSLGQMAYFFLTSSISQTRYNCGLSYKEVQFPSLRWTHRHRVLAVGCDQTICPNYLEVVALFWMCEALWMCEAVM